MELSVDELKRQGIDIPLIAAERISLKKVLVEEIGVRKRLVFMKNSSLTVEY